LSLTSNPLKEASKLGTEKLKTKQCKQFLFTIVVHSSHTITLDLFIKLQVAGLSIILQVGSSVKLKFSGNFNAQYAVRPPCNKVAATSQEATANATSPFYLISANIKFNKKSFFSTSWCV